MGRNVLGKHIVCNRLNLRSLFTPLVNLFMRQGYPYGLARDSESISRGFLYPPVKYTLLTRRIIIWNIMPDDHLCEDLISQPRFTGSMMTSTDSKASTTVSLNYIVSANPLAPVLEVKLYESPK